MRHFPIAAAMAALLAATLPTMAQDAKVAPESAETAIRCGVVFMLEGRATSDAAWQSRGDALVERGSVALGIAGFSDEEVLAVVDATKMVAGFTYGKPDSAYTVDKCVAVERETP